MGNYARHRIVNPFTRKYNADNITRNCRLSCYLARRPFTVFCVFTLLYLLTFPCGKQVHTQFAVLGWTVKPRLHDTTCCHTGCQTGWQPVVSCIQTFDRFSNPFDNRFARCQSGLTTTGFDNLLYLVGLCNRLSNRLYNPNPVWQPVERTVAVRSKRLSNRIDNRFDNSEPNAVHLRFAF